MNIIEIQDKLWKHIGKDNYYKTTEEFKDSLVVPGLKNHNLLMEALSSPSILPLFNPLTNDEFSLLIFDKTDIKAFNSEGNTPLLLAMDKCIDYKIIEKLIPLSDIKHKNNMGVNALVLAVLNQKLLPTNMVSNILKESDSFTLTKRGLSPEFFINRDINISMLEYKHLSLKKTCKKNEENESKKINKKIKI